MLSTGHALIGIYLVHISPNPVIGGGLAFVSHYLMDLIPHGDEGLGEWIKERPKRIVPVELADLAVLGACIVLLKVLSGDISWAAIIIGTIASTLPDWLSEVYSESRNPRAPLYPLLRHLPKIKPLDQLLGWHHRTHHTIHALLNRPVNWRIGVVYQLIVTGLFVWLLVSL